MHADAYYAEKENERRGEGRGEEEEEEEEGGEGTWEEKGGSWSGRKGSRRRGGLKAGMCVCGYQCLTRECNGMLHHIANDH